jgi:phosphoribosyl 1,2-cyclic phosphodiesterase
MLNVQRSSVSSPKELGTDQLLIRINGTLPDIETLGDVEKSERAAEVKRHGINTNTSCSFFALSNENTNQIFHMLVDVGQGIVESLQKGVSELGFNNSSSSSLPDAILITHSHEDHIRELAVLADKAVGKAKHLRVYCTSECHDQILDNYPQLSSMIKNNQFSFTMLQPGQNFDAGPFSVMPILSYHGENAPPGSVIYIVKLANRKVIVGWDFLSLPNADENLLWNPDLAILGTQSYNPHPQTGMISVSEAFELIRRWNAKECYIVQYRGLLDFEEASNQWFRGPTKAMTTDELQKVIDSHLKIVGSGRKFKMTVAKEGMVWDSDNNNNNATILQSEDEKQRERENLQESSDQNKLSPTIEIKSLQNYILRIENEPKADKLKLMIEDAVNRYNLEFDRPRRLEKTGDSNEEEIIVARGVKGMLAKGPDLRMEIVPRSENDYIINARASKGKKKDVFNDEILISNIDADRLKKYIKDNFMVYNASAAAAK